MKVPEQVHDVLLHVLVDPQLAVTLLPVLPIRTLDVRMALEHHDEGPYADLCKEIILLRQLVKFSPVDSSAPSSQWTWVRIQEPIL